MTSHDLLRSIKIVCNVVDNIRLPGAVALSWLATDIITAKLDGRQPVQLTARHLFRCADIPLEWQQQRHFLGFS